MIAGFVDLGIEAAMAALADVEAGASALAAVGEMEADAAAALVADTVDALVVRGASWVEPKAVDLDVRRLYDLAAGVPRARLRRVVGVGTGGITSVDLWDDRAEARTAGPSIHIDPIAADESQLELRDGYGGTVDIDLSSGRAATDGGSTGRVDGRADYLGRLLRHAVAAARRDPSVDQLNAQRRRIVVVTELLDAPPGLVEHFDDEVAVVAAGGQPQLLEVTPVAVRAPYGWVLSIESWSDHWRVIVRDDGHALWTAVADDGTGFGGDVLDGDVLRFDPALPPAWTSVTLSRLAPDGTVVDVEVGRR